jgi:predicted phosphodiesterase
MSLNNFIHFGCWNKGTSYLRSVDSTKTASNLTNVMRKLNEFTEATHPEFIIVAGDNYYPNKLTVIEGDKKIKIKKFEEDDMFSGFDSLPKNVEIDVVMGNHDYETNLYVSNLDQVETSCKILRTEYMYEKTLNENLNIVINKARLFQDDTLILMIDTTIYDDDYAKGVIDCYKIHPEFANKQEPLTVQSVRTYQSDFIKNSIDEYIDIIKNVIIIGHHPITGYKMKGNDTKLISSPGKPLLDFFYNDIYKRLLDKKIDYYYLCADLHQYQIGNIAISPSEGDYSNSKMFIKQYIVGTGGADLDAYPFKEGDEGMREMIVMPPISDDDERNGDGNGKIERYNVEYLMTTEEVALPGYVYGFLQCSKDGDDLVFKFINIGTKPITEENPRAGIQLLSGNKGGMKKTRRYKILKNKNKKITHKQNKRNHKKNKTQYKKHNKKYNKKYNKKQKNTMKH